MNWLSKSVAGFLVAGFLSLPLAHAATISCSGVVAINAACSCCDGAPTCCVAPKVFPEDQTTPALVSGLTLIHPPDTSSALVVQTFLRKSHVSLPQVDLIRGPPVFLKFVRLLI